MGQNSSTAKRKTHSNYHKCTSCCPRWHSLLLGLVGNQFLRQGQVFLNFFHHNKITMLYLLGLSLSNIKICLIIWTIGMEILSFHVTTEIVNNRNNTAYITKERKLQHKWFLFEKMTKSQKPWPKTWGPWQSQSWISFWCSFRKLWLLWPVYASGGGYLIDKRAASPRLLSKFSLLSKQHNGDGQKKSALRRDTDNK